MKVTSFAAKATKLAIALSSSIFWSASAQNDEKECRCNPDPHFKTWDDHYYDYHGGCILVLIHNPALGLDVHVSTVPTIGYSYIDKVGLNVGAEQVSLPPTSSLPLSLGGHPFTFDSGTNVYELSLGDGQYVRVTEWNSSFSVVVRGSARDFSSSLGMCGSWGDGLLGRDGVSTIDPGDDIAQEWKVDTVLDGDIIGSTAGACQDAIPHSATCEKVGCLCQGNEEPDRCPCPGGEGADNNCGCATGHCITEDDIKSACEGIVPEEQRLNCEYDVQTTGDVNWGTAPFYEDSRPTESWCHDKPPGHFHKSKTFQQKVSKCEDRHEDAECVYNCIESDDFQCIPGLCHETEEAPLLTGPDKCDCRVPLF